jgi:hypothetical protein
MLDYERREAAVARVPVPFVQRDPRRSRREGDPDAETYRGNVFCTGPRAWRRESKRSGETLRVVYAKQKGIPVRMARPFNNPVRG